MILKHVEIKNFRSIKECKIEFDPNCRVLVGINESGKSNVLKALAFLDLERLPNKKVDLRDALPNEDEIEVSEVSFDFKFGNNETNLLINNIGKKLLFKSASVEIVKRSGISLNLKDFCFENNRSLYEIDILEEVKTFRYWPIINKYSLCDGWKKPSTLAPSTYTIEINGKAQKLIDYKLIYGPDFNDIPTNYLVDAKIADLSIYYGSTIIESTKQLLPDTIFWEYDESNLLPNSVSIAEFANDPDVCIPLKNMFLLAGISDVKSKIDSAKLGTDNQFQNFLDRVAKKTTAHFRSVWKEYKDIEFSLRLNSNLIVPGVKEKNTHDFARRSDGFKRFVTFLLMISVNVKTNNLLNSLLLIDEPEVGLHPVGARHLRDELIKISSNNYVVYSTHSVFMIDPQKIKRHIIVNKKNEVTNIETAAESNVIDEEVLFNALGHSLFSILKEKNIIFEGWKDKKLFNVAIEKAPSHVKQKFSNVGICHSRGAKAIKSITPLIELSNRSCLIISDNDNPAKDQQKLYFQEKGYGVWKTYSEIDPNTQAITGEDFVENDFIAKQINSTLSIYGIVTFDANLLPEEKDKLAAISRWLHQSGISKEKAKDYLFAIKDNIFENLKYDNISKSYFEFLERIDL